MDEDVQRQLNKLAAYALASQSIVFDLLRVLTEDESVNPERTAQIVRDAAHTAFREDAENGDPLQAEREAFLQWAEVHARNNLGANSPPSGPSKDLG